MREKLIIAITNAQYPKDSFPPANRNFFINGYDFCYVSPNNHIHFRVDGKDEFDNIITINRSGLLLINDGWGNNFKSSDFDNIIKSLKNLMSPEIDIYIWYHTSTKADIEKHLNLSFRNVLGLGESSHKEHDNEVFTHIIPYFKEEIKIDDIIKKCFGPISEESAFQEELKFLLPELNDLSYHEDGKLIENGNSHRFLNKRNSIISNHTE